MNIKYFDQYIYLGFKTKCMKLLEQLLDQSFTYNYIVRRKDKYPLLTMKVPMYPSNHSMYQNNWHTTNYFFTHN